MEAHKRRVCVCLSNNRKRVAVLGGFDYYKVQGLRYRGDGNVAFNVRFNSAACCGSDGLKIHRFSIVYRTKNVFNIFLLNL